jgi:altronate dehydratase small subunit
MSRAIVLDKTDNVATILDATRASCECTLQGARTGPVVTLADLPFGHKVAVLSIRAGDSVIKYGHSIGRATRDINIGDHVHIHNVESLRGRGDLGKQEK